jgi:hypothetical protein
MIDVLDTIRRLTEEKRAANRFPTHVLFIDLQKQVAQQVRDELNALHRDGIIKVGKTVNDKYIELK